MRWALVVLLGAITLFFAVFGALTMAAAFGGEGDSADGIYLAIGGIELLIAGAFGVAALLVARPGHHAYGWLVIAAFALLGATLPYADWVGNAGYAANAMLALLAAGAAVAYVRSPRVRAEV
jgi:hypothetical protein